MSFELDIQGFVTNIKNNVYETDKNTKIKTSWMMNGLKCISWSKSIGKYLKEGMEIEILEAGLKTIKFTDKDDESIIHYLDNRLIVKRIKLIDWYEEKDFVGIGKSLSPQKIEEANNELTKNVEFKKEEIDNNDEIDFDEILEELKDI